MKVLILGGTTEASALARMLAGDPRFDATLSLAGLTSDPVAQPIPCRTGGFGGADGLAAYLAANHVDALVDATHPFAAQMSRHAAAQTILRLAILRPPWTPGPGDRWQAVADMTEAAAALGPTPRRVLLTIGQKDLQPFSVRTHIYKVRSVEPPQRPPPGAEVIIARGPFDEAAERRLLEAHAIEVLVTKNSGGTATGAKLDAARALGLPVIMVARPPPPDGIDRVPDAAAAMRWLEAHATLRGE